MTTAPASQRPYKVDELELAGVKLDASCQPRVAIDEATVADYSEAMKDGFEFPPIVVFFDGSDHWLADGFHRFHAARHAHLAFLPGEIHTGTRRDAVLYSVGANVKHGMRRTEEDKRRAVLALLADEEWGVWSDNEIARRTGVSFALVASLRAASEPVSVPEESDSALSPAPLPSTCSDVPPTLTEQPPPKVRKYINKHGQQGEMNVANIGRAATEKALSQNAQMRVAVEAALRADPLGGTAAIAKIVGCSRPFVHVVRNELGLPAPKMVQSPSVKMRAERFDQATNTFETSGEWLEQQEVADFAGDVRLSRWIDRLTRAIASMRKVRTELEEVREQESEEA